MGEDHATKFVWSSIELHGERFSFTGTGKELFKGYLKVAAAYLLLVGIPMPVGYINKPAGVVLQILGLLAILLVLPYAIWWSRRTR